MIIQLILYLSSLVSALALNPVEWRSQSIYFLITDRFGRTDNSITAPCNTTERIYCGGSWQGIINHLDYIQGMGFTAIWITPVTKQISGITGYGTAYAGYWQQDIYSLNANFGNDDDLGALAYALHDRGMYLMVDVVANHMGSNGPSNNVTYSIYTPFNSQKYFHSYCLISNYNNQTDVEDCWLGDTIVPLPDLNTTRADVKTVWYDWVRSLVSNYSIDGLRIDTVKHVQKDFWPDYVDAAGVFCIGEVFSGDPSYTCPYQDDVNGLLNYPIFFPLLEAFQSTQGNISGLYDMIYTVKSKCKDTTLLGNFIENHDNPRFANYTNDTSLTKNALAYLFFTDGIPIIYAGQEQHYSGGNDPGNREAVWLSGYNTSSELYIFIAFTNSIRAFAISDSTEYLTYKHYPIYQDNSTIAIRKGNDDHKLITVLSNLGHASNNYTLNLSGTGYSAGEQVTELYSCAMLTVDTNGSIPVPMINGLPSVLYPTYLISGSGLCY